MAYTCQHEINTGKWYRDVPCGNRAGFGLGGDYCRIHAPMHPDPDAPTEKVWIVDDTALAVAQVSELTDKSVVIVSARDILLRQYLRPGRIRIANRMFVYRDVKEALAHIVRIYDLSIENKKDEIATLEGSKQRVQDVLAGVIDADELKGQD